MLWDQVWQSRSSPAGLSIFLAHSWGKKVYSNGVCPVGTSELELVECGGTVSEDELFWSHSCMTTGRTRQSSSDTGTGHS